MIEDIIEKEIVKCSFCNKAIDKIGEDCFVIFPSPSGDWKVQLGKNSSWNMCKNCFEGLSK